MEHPTNRAGLRHVSAILADQVAELADDSVAIAGDDLNQHPHPAGAVPLERHFFKLLAFQLACAAQYRPFDIFVGHVFVLCGQDRRA